jgi:hypothetical protein
MVVVVDLCHPHGMKILVTSVIKQSLLLSLEISVTNQEHYMKPDVIVVWPRNCDYPLWRQMIRDNRERFNEVIIVFMETNAGDDYKEFVKTAMFQDHVLFVQSPTPTADQDWRDVAIKAALLQSLHSEWLWFTEQDFFPKENFFEEAETGTKRENIGYIGVQDGARLHPCSLFIKRSVLNQTKRNFGIVKDVSDHFGQIQRDLENMSNGLIQSPDRYTHMAGLSHNMRLLYCGEAPNHRAQDFADYLKSCMKVTVSLDERFKKLIETYINY